MAQADSVPIPNLEPITGASPNPSTKRRSADRRYFVGGSDARTIMGGDESALLRLWQEKRGAIEPADLSGNLLVQLGLATEDLNRRWYEANTGQALKDVQRQVRHPALPWMASTLDGRVAATGRSSRPSSCRPVDAPDLIAPTTPVSKVENPVQNSKEHLNGGQDPFIQEASAHRRAKTAPHLSKTLDPEQSAVLRDRLVAELKNVNSAEEAATWAHGVLSVKNSLARADAECVERAFQATLATFAAGAADEQAQPAKTPRTASIDKSLLALPAPRRIRDLSNPLRGSLVWSAAGFLPMSTISALRNHERLVARSATSSLCHSVEDTIAKSITAAMNSPGGTRTVSIRLSLLAPCG